jgi:hypothetical protein
VRVSLVEPGAVETELAGHNRPEVLEGLRTRFAGMERLQSQDIADAISYVVTRPRHVAINELLVRPTSRRAEAGLPVLARRRPEQPLVGVHSTGVLWMPTEAEPEPSRDPLLLPELEAKPGGVGALHEPAVRLDLRLLRHAATGAHRRQRAVEVGHPVADLHLRGRLPAPEPDRWVVPSTDHPSSTDPGAYSQPSTAP